MSSLLADVLTAAGFDVDVASNVVDALESARDFDPDAALLDIALGDGPSGLDLARVLDLKRPDIALIFLTRHPDRRTAGLDAGDIPQGCGFLRKDMVANSQYLVSAIEKVLAENAGEVRHDLAEDRPLANLTRKQLDVLRMAAQGLTNTAIAQRRNTSERSVEALMHAIFVTLGIESHGDVNPRVEAVRQYIDGVGMPERP